MVWQQVDEIVFLVLLREPLDRMHSGFYHQLRRYPGTNETFQNYVERALRNSWQGCVSGRRFGSAEDFAACDDPMGGRADPLYLSMYAPQLERWFNHFPAKNFVIAPWLSFTAPDKHHESLMEFMVKDKMRSTLKQADDPPRKGHYHNPLLLTSNSLDRDLQRLNHETREDLELLVKEMTGVPILAKLLAPKMAEGLTLFGYTGAVNDTEAIATYIQDSW